MEQHATSPFDSHTHKHASKGKACENSLLYHFHISDLTIAKLAEIWKIRVRRSAPFQRSKRCVEDAALQKPLPLTYPCEATKSQGKCSIKQKTTNGQRKTVVMAGSTDARATIIFRRLTRVIETKGAEKGKSELTNRRKYNIQGLRMGAGIRWHPCPG